MVAGALFSFLHFVAVLAIAGTLFFEWFTLNHAPSLADARRLQSADRWYGIAAGVLLVVGLVRVFQYEKGKDYYVSNTFFLLKMALFIAVGLISIYPTVRFIAWGKLTRQGQVPVVSAAELQRLRRVLAAELLLLAGIVLCASLMAKGLGVG
jgi:putative membrane protein